MDLSASILRQHAIRDTQRTHTRTSQEQSHTHPQEQSRDPFAFVWLACCKPFYTHSHTHTDRYTTHTRTRTLMHTACKLDFHNEVCAFSEWGLKLFHAHLYSTAAWVLINKLGWFVQFLTLHTPLIFILRIHLRFRYLFLALLVMQQTRTRDSFVYTPSGNLLFEYLFPSQEEINHETLRPSTPTVPHEWCPWYFIHHVIYEQPLGRLHACLLLRDPKMSAVALTGEEMVLTGVIFQVEYYRVYSGPDVWDRVWWEGTSDICFWSIKVCAFLLFQSAVRCLWITCTFVARRYL